MMSATSLSGTTHAALIRDNFQEIYHAAHAQCVDGINLVANYSGTRVYDSTRGWGHTWKWFYRVVHWITGKNQRFDRLKAAILHTHNLYHRQFHHIRKDLESYESYLALAGGGYDVVEDNFHRARKTISLWHSSYSPFIKWIGHLKHPKLEKLFRLCFTEQIPQASMALLWSSPESKSLEGCQKIIDLEGLTQGPLPLEIFKKIIRKKTLNVLDHKELNKWIKKINECSSCVKLAHEAIKAIATRYIKPLKDGDVSIADPAPLEIYLEDKGCVIFRQQDPEHISWRQKLKKGAILAHQGEELLLGTQMYSAKSHGDNTLVFSIQNRLEHVVFIAQNPAALGMKRCRQKLGSGFGLEPVEMLDIESEGRWALIECLKPISTHKWMNQLAGGFTKEDEAIINELAAFIGWLVKQNFTPEGFSSESVMYDKNYHLKALHPMSRNAFDFNALEDFVLQCASGNLVVFQHLMTKSGLCKHAIAQFYEETVESFLKDDKTSVEDLAAMHKIVDPKVVDRAAALRHDVLKLRTILIEKVRESQPDKGIKLIEKETAASLIKFYKNTKAAGILPRQWLQQLAGGYDSSGVVVAYAK